MKDRKLRKFEFTELPDAQVQEVDPGKKVNAGCGIELTRVVRENMETWYTFGLEAFGSPERSGVEHILKASLEALLSSLTKDGRHGLKLGADNSFGYPAWLFMPSLGGR